MAYNPPSPRTQPTGTSQYDEANSSLNQTQTHSSAGGELAPNTDSSHSANNREVPQHILNAEVLDPERKSRHQASDHDERRGEDHACLARPPVRDETKQQDPKDLSDDEGIGDPRLVVGCVLTAEHVREDDVYRGGNVLLVAVGEVGCGLGDGIKIPVSAGPFGMSLRWAAATHATCHSEDRCRPTVLLLILTGL